MNEKILKKRLLCLIDSKSQNDKKIIELESQAKDLRKKLQIGTD